MVCTGLVEGLPEGLPDGLPEWLGEWLGEGLAEGDGDAVGEVPTGAPVGPLGAVKATSFVDTHGVPSKVLTTSTIYVAEIALFRMSNASAVVGGIESSVNVRSEKEKLM